MRVESWSAVGRPTAATHATHENVEYHPGTPALPAQPFASSRASALGEASRHLVEARVALAPAEHGQVLQQRYVLSDNVESVGGGEMSGDTRCR